MSRVPPFVWALLGVGILIGIGFAILPAPPKPPPVTNPAPPVIEKTPPPARDEFEDYAERMKNSENIYYGTLQIPKYLKVLESQDPRQIFVAHAFLGKHYLRFAETGKSIEHFEAALAMARGDADRALLLEQLAVAHLKQAELDNCVAMHGPESCILPLSPAARHKNRRGSEAAVARLMELLEMRPENAKARWLLTFAHMTLGTSPPEKWTVPLPPSEYDVKRFRNVAPEVGITAVNHAGGAAMDDFDNDGFLDIITSDCDPSCGMHFWHNDGNGKFTDRPIPGQLGGLNLIHGDFDNDGFLDVLVLRGGWMKEDGRIRVSLLRNRGDGTFEDVTKAAGLADVDTPTQTAAFADYDNDGRLDLFIGSESAPCRLYHNEGGRFVNATRKAGVENGGYTKGCAWGDYDNDGLPDLYVSNFGQPNRLYHNNGDGTFTDVARELGVAQQTHSFACWFFDYDNDGWLDLFVAGYSREAKVVAEDMLGWPNEAERPRLYHNVKGKLVDVTKEMGLWHVWQPMGANFGDLDNDGRLDIYLGTGFPEFDSIKPNVMLRNAGTQFQNVTGSGGFGHAQKGHGVAWGDIDNDGDEDIFIEIGGFYPGDGFRNALFLNPGHGAHWICLRFVGVKANRFGVGARVKVTTTTREIHRVVGTGGSFGGNSLQQEIGLGDETPKSLEVTWPGGAMQKFDNVPVDQCLEVREGGAALKVVARKPLKLGN